MSSVSVALLMLPQTTSSTLFGMLDLFASAGRDWSLVVEGAAGEGLATPRLVAARAEPVPLWNGVPGRPDATIGQVGVPDVVCVPNFMFDPVIGIAGLYPEEVAWLRRCHEEGAVVASACSGAFLLAEAGLLDGGEATTHWAYCEPMRRHYPRVTLRPNKVLTTAGPGQRVITAGGGSSWQDLTLYLTARLLGIEHAQHLARLYLIEWHGDGQLPFAAMARSRQTIDRQVAEAQEWLAEHYRVDAPVAALAARSGLSERGFTRRFKEATGLSPLAYAHTLRLEEAKQLLERSELPVEEIAAEVGYADGSFFRRLFQRSVGLTPAAYRRKFHRLRRGLAGEGA